jgi:hypothetical protein
VLKKLKIPQRLKYRYMQFLGGDMSVRGSQC